MGVVADMSCSSQPQKSISPALPWFVKRSHEIQRSSQPEMRLHNPSEAKRKNTIIFSLVDHDCLVNMLPKKGGSGFSNFNPIHFHLQKTTPPRFFLYHLHKTWCIEGVFHHQLEIGGYPPPNLRLELPTLGKKLPPTNCTCRGGCTFAALRTLRTLGALRGGNTHMVLQWFERVGA